MIDTMVCTVERIIMNEKDGWDIFSAIGPTVAASVAIGVAVWQYRLSKKQHNFNLLNEREECKKDFLRLLRDPSAIIGNKDRIKQMYWLMEFEELADKVAVLYSDSLSKKMHSICSQIKKQKSQLLNKQKQFQRIRLYAEVYKEMRELLKKERCS